MAETSLYLSACYFRTVVPKLKLIRPQTLYLIRFCPKNTWQQSTFMYVIVDGIVVNKLFIFFRFFVRDPRSPPLKVQYFLRKKLGLWRNIRSLMSGFAPCKLPRMVVS